MIIFGPGPEDYPPWRYHKTDYPCPTCQKPLTKVDVSTMLTCDQGHGPYFLV